MSMFSLFQQAQIGEKTTTAEYLVSGYLVHCVFSYSTPHIVAAEPFNCFKEMFNIYHC